MNFYKVNIKIIFLCLLFSIQDSNSNPIKPIDKSIHALWDIQLKKYVSKNGKINYKSWANNIEEIYSYLKLVKKFEPNSNWSKHELMSYWINVYNSLSTLQVIKNLSTNHNFKIIKNRKITLFKLGKTDYSLIQIENILKKFKDPRIYFVINCHAKSSPNLLNFAFRSYEIDNQLDAATKLFINDNSKNKLRKNQLELSKIFKWISNYFSDRKEFIKFIKKYSTTEIDEQPKITFLKFNWQLRNY